MRVANRFEDSSSFSSDAILAFAIFLSLFKNSISKSFEEMGFFSEFLLLFLDKCGAEFMRGSIGTDVGLLGADFLGGLVGAG